MSESVDLCPESYATPEEQARLHIATREPHSRITIHAEGSPGMNIEEVFLEGIALANRLGCWINLNCGSAERYVLIHPGADLRIIEAQYTVACERESRREREQLDKMRNGLK